MSTNDERAMELDAFFVWQMLAAICEGEECSRDRMAARDKALIVSNALPDLLARLDSLAGENARLEAKNESLHTAGVAYHQRALDAEAELARMRAFVQDCADGLPELDAGKCRARAMALAAKPKGEL
jgi:hypothetical protein